MSRIIAKGATSQSIYVEILDSASTSGGRKTGIVYNSAGLTAYYVRNGASATAITLATLAAANSAYSSGGFKEVDATNMPGVYRLDLPDAAVASGADSVVVTVKGASGAAQVSAEIQLSPRVDVDTIKTNPVVNAGTVTFPTTATLASTTNITAGTIATVSGNVTGSVGSVVGAVGSVTGAVGSVTGNVGGNVVGSVASVTAGVTVTTNNDKTGYRLSATGVDDVWDEALSGHTTAGTSGKALSDAGAAGDPWGTALPGAYSAGTAGYLIGTNINATVSSRASQTSVDTVDDFLDTEIAAIKAKTDNLPAAPAATGDAMTLTSGERNSVADALLARNVAGGSSAGRLVKEALYVLRNKTAIAGGTLTVYGTDDTTSAFTATVATTAGDPISSIDPV